MHRYIEVLIWWRGERVQRTTESAQRNAADTQERSDSARLDSSMRARRERIRKHPNKTAETTSDSRAGRRLLPQCRKQTNQLRFTASFNDLTEPAAEKAAEAAARAGAAAADSCHTVASVLTACDSHRTWGRRWGPALEMSELTIITRLACIEHRGPLNDSKVSRAEEGRVAKKCCWKEVSPSTEQRMQPVQQISARCASRISLQNPKTAHGGADGMRGEARRPTTRDIWAPTSLS
jgi:hypothetical protein